MKSTLLLCIVTVISGTSVYAQTVPVSFRNPKSQIFKDVPGKAVTVQSLDSTQGTTTETVKFNYKTIANNLRTTSSTIKKNANNEFERDAEGLDNPLNEAEFNEFRTKLDNYEAVKAAALKQAAFFEKKAKAFEYLQRTEGTWTWRPVRNSVDAEMYYNGSIADSKAKFLSNSLLSFSSDGGKASLFNEIYADYFGPIRMGFGALISNKQQPVETETIKDKEEKREDAMQRLLGGGGNGVINLSYPLFNVDNGKGFAIKFGLAPKFGLDIPKIGTDKNDYAVNYNFGAEGTIFYSGALDVFTFYSNFRFGGIGGNNVFFNNLEKGDKKFFGYNQVSLGLGISSSFRLAYNYYFGSSYVNENFPGAISFTIIPN